MPLSQPPIQQPLQQNGLFPQTWVQWFSSIRRLLAYTRNDGSYAPPTLADADAANNSVYYSSDASKLVYKDSGGNVNNLY